MKRTMHTSEKQRTCQAQPAEVYALVADLSRLPDWWLWSYPHPRLELDEHDVVDVAGAGVFAAPGAEVEVRSSGGAGTLKRGKRMTWGPKSCRYRCESADQDCHVRLIVKPGPEDATNGVTALDVVIEPDGLGSLVTLRRESEAHGRSVLKATGRWAHDRGWGLDRPIKRLVEIAENKTPHAH